MKNSKKMKGTQQGRKFIATAREHGCDESEAAFNAKLKKLAAPKKRTAKKGKKK